MFRSFCIIVSLYIYMHFLVDKEMKIIFGWSTKCGCSHIKNIYYFLMNNKIDNIIHTKNDYNSLPHDIENYTTIIICRNPYKRLVSGFLDKYKKYGEFRSLWKYDTITFSRFIEELIKNNWNMIDEHHFMPQTTGDFNNKIMLSKYIKCYDIENIDYSYIEKLYNKKIPEIILTKREGHERKKYNIIFNEHVYNLDMSIYYNYNIDIKYFYNKDIEDKLYHFYKNDFLFFNLYGIDYTNSII
jgi:hypothetical protein